MIHRPKRRKTTAMISDILARMAAEYNAAEIAKTTTRTPSEITPSGLLGKGIPQVYGFSIGIKAFI
jgi:hypothetical protein